MGFGMLTDSNQILCLPTETEVSEPPKSPVKLVNFQQSEK